MSPVFVPAGDLDVPAGFSKTGDTLRLCEFVFEFRNLAVDNSDELHQRIVDYIDKQLLPTMQQEQADTQVILEILAKAPGLDTPPSEAIVRAAQSICHSEEQLKVAYATEAGLFQQAKIPTIV